MKLQALIDGLDLRITHGSGDQAVIELTDDSRQVQPGWLFIARSGSQTTGRQYIKQALEQGAGIIVTDQPPGPALLSPAVSWVVGGQIDTALTSRLAGRFFGHPSRSLKLVGITGTNGKTTTCYLARHLLARAGIKAGLVGTVEIDDGHACRPAELTTPGAVELQRLLAAMVQNGCQAVIAEISSHALDQGRTADLTFHAGVFTNLTGDHLDYHQSMERYATAKARLFEQLPASAWAVVNRDDAWHQRMLAGTNVAIARRIGCSLKAAGSTSGDSKQAGGVELTARIVSMTPVSTVAHLHGPFGCWQDVAIPLVGRHNVYNMLEALAAAASVADDWDSLKPALTDCPGVPGRLERVLPAGDPAGTVRQPVVLVDYAHTDDALRHVLQALRPVTRGRLRVVFGCGGDRDRTKRPRMAAIACQLADAVMVTSDNPRTEDPAAIIRDILAGVPVHARGCVQVEPDRARAIKQAIEQADGDDVVLLAGKGHEDYQIIGHARHHFDDRQQAAAALAARLETELNRQVNQP